MHHHCSASLCRVIPQIYSMVTLSVSHHHKSITDKSSVKQTVAPGLHIGDTTI